MPPVSIPLSIAAALPIVGQIVSSLLIDDRQKPGVNAAIAGVFLLLVAAVCALLAGNFTGNWTLTIGVIVAYCAVLMRSSLGMLTQFFDLVPSPIANALFGKPPTLPATPAAAAPLTIERASTPRPTMSATRPTTPPPPHAGG